MVQIYSTGKEYKTGRKKKIFKALTTLLFLVCFAGLLIVLGVSLYKKVEQTGITSTHRNIFSALTFNERSLNENIQIGK